MANFEKRSIGNVTPYVFHKRRTNIFLPKGNGLKLLGFKKSDCCGADFIRVQGGPNGGTLMEIDLGAGANLALGVDYATVAIQDGLGGIVQGQIDMPATTTVNLDTVGLSNSSEARWTLSVQAGKRNPLDTCGCKCLLEISFEIAKDLSSFDTQDFLDGDWSGCNFPYDVEILDGFAATLTAGAGDNVEFLGFTLDGDAFVFADSFQLPNVPYTQQQALDLEAFLRANMPAGFLVSVTLESSTKLNIFVVTPSGEVLNSFQTNVAATPTNLSMSANPLMQHSVSSPMLAGGEVEIKVVGGSTVGTIYVDQSGNDYLLALKPAPTTNTYRATAAETGCCDGSFVDRTVVIV